MQTRFRAHSLKTGGRGVATADPICCGMRIITVA
jgi:hypothetical protein